MSQIAKAYQQDVKIGLITVEGLLLPNGEFAIGVSQIAKLF